MVISSDEEVKVFIMAVQWTHIYKCIDSSREKRFLSCRDYTINGTDSYQGYHEHKSGHHQQKTKRQLIGKTPSYIVASSSVNKDKSPLGFLLVRVTSSGMKTQFVEIEKSKQRNWESTWSLRNV